MKIELGSFISCVDSMEFIVSIDLISAKCKLHHKLEL